MSATAAPNLAVRAAALPVLFGLSTSHLLNDMIQSLLPAIYPILKTNYDLDFGQIGLLTLAFQITASLLQPLVGMVTDRKPLPYSLALGMGASLCGLLLLSRAGHFWSLLVAAALVGLGSSVFHPEASRVARLASGGRFGFAQSIFQVGGNLGSAIGPLLAAFVVIPHGQGSVAWFSAAALLAMLLLASVGRWYAARLPARRTWAPPPPALLPRQQVLTTLWRIVCSMSRRVCLAVRAPRRGHAVRPCRSDQPGGRGDGGQAGRCAALGAAPDDARLGRDRPRRSRQT